MTDYFLFFRSDTNRSIKIIEVGYVFHSVPQNNDWLRRFLLFMSKRHDISPNGKVLNIILGMKEKLISENAERIVMDFYFTGNITKH